MSDGLEGVVAVHTELSDVDGCCMGNLDPNTQRHEQKKASDQNRVHHRFLRESGDIPTHHITPARQMCKNNSCITADIRSIRFLTSNTLMESDSSWFPTFHKTGSS